MRHVTPILPHVRLAVVLRTNGIPEPKVVAINWLSCHWNRSIRLLFRVMDLLIALHSLIGMGESFKQDNAAILMGFMLFVKLTTHARIVPPVSTPMQTSGNAQTV